MVDADRRRILGFVAITNEKGQVAKPAANCDDARLRGMAFDRAKGLFLPQGVSEAGNGTAAGTDASSRVMDRRTAVKIIGLGALAGCGGIVADTDSGADVHEDDATGEAESGPDADVPDVVPDVPEVAPDVSEDEAGESADTPADVDVMDTDAPDVSAEDGPAEAEADAGCVETVRDESEVTTGPEPIRGASPETGIIQTNTVVTRFTDRVGADCEAPGPTPLMIRRRMDLSLPLDEANFGRAKGVDMESLDGQRIITELRPDGITIARKIAKGMITYGDRVGGGPSELSVVLESMRVGYAVIGVYDTDGITRLGSIDVYEVGPPVALLTMPIRAAIVYDMQPLRATCGVAIIDASASSVLGMADGGVYPWRAGDGGDFTFTMEKSGTQLLAWEWARVGIAP